METIQVSTSTKSRPKIGSLKRQERTEVMIHLCATSSASGRGPSVAGFPAGGNPIKKPHSFPDIEAETAIAKPLHGHTHGHMHSWSLYFALFANPVKRISNASSSQSLALAAVNPYN